MWTENVKKLEGKILAFIGVAKRQGTVGMSKDNLRACIDTSGLTLPNANAFTRAFGEALDNLKPKLKGFNVYGELS